MGFVGWEHAAEGTVDGCALQSYCHSSAEIARCELGEIVASVQPTVYVAAAVADVAVAVLAERGSACFAGDAELSSLRHYLGCYSCLSHFGALVVV